MAPKKLRVLFVTTGRINPDGKLYYPPLVENQIRSLKPFMEWYKIVNIYSLNPFFVISKIREVRRFSGETDIIHAQYGSLTSLVASLGRKQKTLIISFGGSDLLGVGAKGFKWTLRNKLTRFLGIVAATSSEKIIVKSRSLCESLPEKIKNKAVVVPNGVDTSIFFPTDKSTARRNLNWDKKFYILFTPSRGNNVIVKNLALAEKVFDMVKDKLKDVTLELILDKQPEEVAQMMSAADCLLLTSLHEGSPNVIKEAMACNLPVVTVNVGDVRERLQNVENCCVVDTYHPNELSDKVIKVLLNGSRTNGREELERQELTSESIASKIFRIYNEALLNPFHGTK